MAARVPGARSIEELWKNLRDGIESVRDLSEEELVAAGVSPENLADPDYVRRGAPVPDADAFDAAFFGFTPRDAEVLDPQARVFLETAWEALEDSGLDPERSLGSIGLFAGAGSNQYLLRNLIGNPAVSDAVGSYQVMLLNEKDFLATRTSYKLNLRGPSVTVQTACSTSLVAVHQACQALLNYQCDVALAGGVSLPQVHPAGYRYQEGMILSPDGRCRAFDAGACGTVVGGGAGVVVLKRLEDALADGDPIDAVILGSATNNDGSLKVGFTAPSVEGQSEVILAAQAAAGVDPDSITYIEAHGTGTTLGDPIEVAALTQAFRTGTTRSAFCALGSIKTNIGHADIAAGVVGLIKTVLALKHREIPPTLHFRRPNPKLELESSPFFVNDTLLRWEPDGPRRAGVSSFGIGGTNAHAVVQEAPETETAPPSRPLQLLPLSAATPTALQAVSERLAAALRTAPHVDLAEAAWTLQTGRRRFPHRRFVVAASREEAADHLQSARGTHSSPSGEAGVAFLFPGQGSQYAGMLRELYEAEPVFRREVDHCCEVLREPLGFDLREVLFPAPGDAARARERISQTAVTQPALFVVEYALARLWMSWGVRPAAMAGHSIGEYVAACLAGVFSLEDALRLVAARGRLMQSAEPGSMLAVFLSESDLRPLLPPGVEIAALNAPELTVVSGPTAAIDAFREELERREIECRPVRTSHAFHSGMMEPILAAFEREVAAVALSEPETPYLSNLTGTWIRPDQATSPRYWADHLRGCVRFSDNLAELLSNPQTALLEVGPGQVLTGLARRQPAARGRVLAAGGARGGSEGGELRAVLEAAGLLWCAGVELDWTAFHHGRTPRRVHLPTYPFERRRYWIDPPQARPAPGPAGVAARLPQLPPAPAPAAPEAPNRRERLYREVGALFEQVGGIPAAAIAGDTHLLEMGFDSLLVVQLNQAVQRKFGLKIPTSRLLNGLGTLDALTSHLETVLPELPEGDAPAPKVEAAPPAETPKSPAAPGSFGPYRPPVRRSDALTPAQQAYLDRFIDRFTAKTARSKEHAQRHRARLADPRVVVGFKPAWKELVYPIVCERSEGSRVWDLDGNEYVDLTMGFGTNLLGHNPPVVMEALRGRLERGIEIGPQSPLAGDLARLFCELTGHERAAFLNTGSEAVQTALRIARTVTGRDRVVVFAGSYHGNFDGVLVRPGAGGQALAVAPGVTEGALADVIVLPYGEPESLERIRREAGRLAAVLVEPVQSRRPDLQPREFLHELRRITRDAGTALIFDEMVTGFRIHPGGAQAWFDIRADLATYGKIAGGGMPIGVIAGRRQFMDAIDGGHWQYGDASVPEADLTFYAGTFCKHPLAMAASHALLQHLQSEGRALQDRLNRAGADLAERLNSHFAAKDLPLRVLHFGSLFRFDWSAEVAHPGLLCYHLLEKGIHLWEGRTAFLSTDHTPDDIAHIERAILESVDELHSAGLLDGARPADWVTPPAPAAPVEPGRYPLTDPQQEIWLECQRGPDACAAYNESLSVRLCGPLDLAALRTALSGLVARHDALRTTFAADGSEQVVNPELTLSLQVEDGALRERIAAEEAETPFDLVSGPLVRARLIRLARDEHELLFTAHHLVMDGHSAGVLIEELAELYSAHVEGRAPNLQQPLQYGEWVSLQSGPEARAAADESERFWKEQFAALPPGLELPADHPQPPVRTYGAACERLVLEPHLLEALRRTAGSARATLFGGLLAAFQAFLHRITGQTDLVIGVMAATQVGLERPLVGHGVNMLPLRLGVNADQPFKEWVRRAGAAAAEAMEYRDCSFGRLVRALNVPRDPSRLPLAGAFFNLDGEADVHFSGLQVEIAGNPRRFCAFPLWFNATPTPRGLRLDCSYNRDLFDPSTIRRWVRHFETLLRAALESPEAPVGDLPLLSAEEQATLLRDWNRTETPLPAGTTLDLIEAQAARAPERVAARCGTQEITYAELMRRADLLAVELRELGVRPEVPVGVCLDRSPDMLAALLAIWKAGGAYLPLDPSFPRARLAQMVETARPPVVVLHSHLRDTASAGEARLIELDRFEWGGRAGAKLDARPEPGSLAYILFTSGSTGTPKGVQIEHRALLNFLLSMQREPGLEPDDRILAVTTLSFDIAGLELFLPLITGAACVIATREQAVDAAALAGMLDEERITVLQATPATWQMLIQSGWRGRPGLKALCGGEAMSPDLARELTARCAEVWNLYGPTETTVWSTLKRIEPRGEITIGRPIANTDVYVLDSRMQPCPIGVTGELYIGGAGLSRGYLHREDLTAERFLPHPFREGERLYRTGDLARWRPDGELECLGRTDHQVKIRGYRLELGEIESALRGEASVKDAVVIVREDQPGDRRLAAYVVPRDASPDPSLLREALRRRLPEYMVPSAWVILDSIPLTPNGKVDRRALPAPEVVRAPEGAVPPRDEVERELCRVWSELLGVSEVSIRDGFWDLGGHSLLAVKLFVEIEKRFGRKLPLATLYRADSIEAMAALLRERPEADAALWSPTVPIRASGSRPNLFLFHGGAGDVLDYHLLAKYLGEDQPVYAMQAYGLDGQEPLDRVEEMAARYLEEVRRIQPRGPYYLGGECFGGLVAYEIAQRLRSAGEEVAFVALMDSYVNRYPTHGISEKRFRSKLYRHLHEVDLHLGRLMTLSGREQCAYLWEGLRSKAKDLLLRMIGRRTLHPIELLPADLRRVREACERAWEQYLPRPYPGRISVFLAAGMPFRSYHDTRLTWAELAEGGAEVHLVPGDHLGMVREPHVGVLAETLRRCMDRAMPTRP